MLKKTENSNMKICLAPHAKQAWRTHYFIFLIANIYLKKNLKKIKIIIYTYPNILNYFKWRLRNKFMLQELWRKTKKGGLKIIELIFVFNILLYFFSAVGGGQFS